MRGPRIEMTTIEKSVDFAFYRPQSNLLELTRVHFLEIETANAYYSIM